jgi:dynein assembly factor 3
MAWDGSTAPQAYASDGTDGVGFIQFWGNSPARDLAADPSMIPEQAQPPEAEEPLSILMTGASDLRHVLMTIAQAQRRQSKRPLHFFIHDSAVETVARHVLFLYLLTDQNMTMRERSEVFLSLYGNTLIREKDETYLNRCVTELLDIVAGQSSHPVSKLIDFGTLKYKDRDEISDVISGWATRHPFDIETLRDQRMRGYYRTRYDHRVNLMDWDYHNGIKATAPIIHWQHFKEFGKSGVSFETRLGSYTQPNRTLASYQEARSKSKGTTVQVRGFWADLLNPPYFGFGIEADPEDTPRLFKKANDQFRNNAMDIAFFNVQALLQEIETGIPMHLPPESNKEFEFPYESPLERLEKTTRVEEVKEDSSGGAKEAAPLADVYSRVRVSLFTGDLTETVKKSKFQKRFHRAYFGNLAVGTILRDSNLMDAEGNPKKGTELMQSFPNEDFGKYAQDSAVSRSLADGAAVICESFKFQCHFDGKVKLGFRHRTCEAAHRLGWGLRRPRTAFPRLEPDMKDMRARELDAQADNFLVFLPGVEAEPLPAGEPIDLSPDDDEPSTADGTASADATDLAELT